MSRNANKSTMSKVIRSKSAGLSCGDQRSLTKNCKFCKDAGKSVEEYTSHFLRETMDPNSRIVCPTLLLIECRFCFKRGHTVSKCKKLADQKNGRNDKMVPNAPVKQAWTTTRKSVVNSFDLLSEFGDSDNETEFESVGSSVTACTDCTVDYDDMSNKVPSYAQMLAKPASVKQPVEVGSRLSILTKARMMRSWADSDSDSD